VGLTGLAAIVKAIPVDGANIRAAKLPIR
jgi:hypothetical protein